MDPKSYPETEFSLVLILASRLADERRAPLEGHDEKLCTNLLGCVQEREGVHVNLMEHEMVNASRDDPPWTEE